MRRASILAAAIVFALIPAAAAGSLDGKIVSSSGLSALNQHQFVVWLEGVPPSPPGSVVPVMAQRGGQFVPSFLIVVAGQSVSMPNEDNVAHNVYSVSPAKQFNLGFYAKGDIKTVPFDRPGLVEVLCQLHNFMRAKILVVPTPYYTKVGADGSFHIRSVPQGKFTLTVWGDGMPSFSQVINISDNNEPLTIRIPSNGSPAPER